MGNTPTTEEFYSHIVLNLPTNDNLSNNVVLALNTIPHGYYDQLLAVALGTQNLGSKGITNIGVGSSHWEAQAGTCVLVSRLLVTSDPVTEADLTAILIGAGMIITAALIALWVSLSGGTYSAVGAIILAALAISGTLVILTVFITKGGEIVTNPLGFIFALVALGVGGYFVYEWFKGRKRTPRTYTPRRTATRRRSG
jgi:heme/copper-type cytochrome/quinol oxidase subunit 4